MAGSVHLMVESGPDRGKEITVPPDGARLGRSSRNDVVMADPSMSRFHCRFFWQPDKGLAVADLGSSNQTMVNGRPVQEQALTVGDVIAIGDSLIKVISATPPAGVAPASGPDAMPGAGTPTPPPARPLFDSPAKRAAGAPRRPRAGVKPLLIIAGSMAVAVILIWALRVTPEVKRPPPRAAVTPSVEHAPAFELSYEKVESSPTNIFRYYLTIADDTLSVQVDDLQSHLHVRKEKKVDPAVLLNLAATLEDRGIFELADDYSGVAPDIYDQMELTITLGRRTHTTRIFNRLEPDAFKSLRETIEEFGKNELGLAVLARSPAELEKMARDAFLQGQKLYDEREVKDGNLSLAIRAYREAELYLETVEPKPDFYGDILAKRNDCVRELQKRYDSLQFMSERAIKLGDWLEAERQLKTICAMIPDRADQRNKEAIKQLLDVERHLTPNR